MPLPTLHVIGIFHTRLDDAHQHCAFSGKARRFPKMMRLSGYRTVMYCNEGSVTEADEQVTMLSNEEFDTHYPRQKPEAFHGDYAKIGERGWPIFNARLIQALIDRLKPGDLICHPFGRAHQALPEIFPHIQQIETGIGYGDKPFGCWRIFESNCWRHYHWGMSDRDPALRDNKGMNRLYSWVVPNFFDLDEWPIGDGSGDYVAYMGRITPEKGTSTMVEIIRADAGKTEFIFAGQGDFDQHIWRPVIRSPNPFHGTKPRVVFLGPVTGKARAELVGRARCSLICTTFIEPFAGAGVESMLVSSPLVSVDYGAPTETVIHGVTGYRCNTLADWLTAIEKSKFLNRSTVAKVSRHRYSLKTCAKLYDAAFRQISDLSGKGWYSPDSYRVTS